MSDIASWVKTVHREVDAEDTDAGRARSVLLRRSYASPIQDVWDALTSPDQLKQWFYPISGELRVGGKYQLEGNASGEIRTCEKPSLLTLTWDFGGGSTDLELRLSPEGDNGAVLELKHTAILPFDDETWAAGLGQFAPGWDHSYFRLDRHLSGDLAEGGSPESLSAEEQQLWELAGQAWGEAVAAWRR